MVSWVQPHTCGRVIPSVSAQSPISILEAEAQKPDVQVAPAPATMPTEHRGARPWLPWAGVAALTLLAFLLRRYGRPIQRFIDKRLTLIGWSVLGLLGGGFALVTLI